MNRHSMKLAFWGSLVLMPALAFGQAVPGTKPTPGTGAVSIQIDNDPAKLEL